MSDKMAIFVNKLSGDRFIIYREEFQEIMDEYELTADQGQLLSWDQATAEELAEQISNELESENFHSVVGLPGDFLKQIKERGFDEKQQREAILALSDSLGSFFS